MRKKSKRFLAFILAIILSLFLTPGALLQKIDAETEVEASVTLQNPKIEMDSSMTAGRKVTYDCVWFGLYPQTEIVDNAGTCGTYGKIWGQNSDYEENSSLYALLKNANGWDKNGDVIISGKKYRRINAYDALHVSSSDDIYTWNSYDTYHYFRYEPIKWRVLKVSSSKIFLLADKSLDSQKYNNTNFIVNNRITWKNSTIRSWLNGYGDYVNVCATDYTSKSFINSAFSSKERSAIASTYLDNKTTGEYSEKNEGDNTTDKIFLLSAYDVYSDDNSAAYGFYKDFHGIDDEARRSKSSTFAKAMGLLNDSADYLGNCTWWLRSPGITANNAALVSSDGHVNTQGDIYNNCYYGVRPAMNLNPTSFSFFTYAGTVCSNGTEDEVGVEEAINKMMIEQTTSTPISKEIQTITAFNKTIAINSRSVSLGAKSSGNGKLTFSSSAKSVASVSSSGNIIPKNYGLTTITIKAAETSSYKAAKKIITVTVVPKKITLTTIKSPVKKVLLLKWKKDKDATKYEIQLCMKKNFKKKTLSRIYGKKVFKQEVKNIKSKTWYVRIRAWAKAGGKTYKGVWSKVKKVKVK